jgi:hypothetical protein
MKQEDHRQLAYNDISIPLVTIDDTIKSRVTILFDGSPVDDLDLVLLRLWNAGNNPIRVEDYKPSIKFSFGNEAHILDAQIWETKVAFRRTSKSVSLKPHLPNRKVLIKLAVFLSGYKGSVIQSGEISEGRVVHKPNEEEQYLARAKAVHPFRVAGYFSLGIALTIYCIGIFHFLFTKQPLSDTLSTILFILMLLLFSFGYLITLTSVVVGSRLRKHSRWFFLGLLNLLLVPPTIYFFIDLVRLIMSLALFGELR